MIRPQYIPVILAPLGFETKFKDYKNLTSTVAITCDMIKKDYEVDEATLFISKNKNAR
jgi:hypothetical protein